MEGCQPAAPRIAQLLDRDDAAGWAAAHGAGVGRLAGWSAHFGTDRRSRKARNLATNQGTVIHLESGDDAVILEGVAEETADRSFVGRIDAAYLAKYKMRLTEAPGAVVIYAVRPRVALAWRERDFPRSATRWRFQDQPHVEPRPR